MAKKSAAKRKAPTDAELEERMRALDDVEDAMHRAFNSGRASRAEITRQAQERGTEAVRLAGVAMEYDDEADEASRLAIITEGSRDRQRIRNARRRARVARKEAKNAEKEARKAEKDAHKAEMKAQKDEKKAEKKAEKEERKAEKKAAKEERKANKGKGHNK